MPSVHVGARCTHGMMYPCAKCTCGCQVYTCYDVPMCQVDTWVPGLHMVWHTHVPGVHVGARCTHIMTYPCVRCAHGITPMCRVYMWVPGVHVVWCTHVPGVHMGAKCTHGMTYPCVGCTCGCQVYTWYDIPMCQVYMWVPGVHMAWPTHVSGVHVGARCTHGMTYPCAGCTAIARGLCTSLQTMTFLMSPSRSDTSILDVPESVQNSLSWTQSTAMPPTTTQHLHSVQHLQLSDQWRGNSQCEVNIF